MEKLTEWVDWFFDAAAQPLFAGCQTSIMMKKEWGNDYGITVMTIEDGRGRWSSPLKRMIEIGDMAIDKLGKSEEFRDKILENFEKTKEELERIFSEIEAVNLDALSETELLNLYLRFSFAYYNMWEKSIFVDGIPIAGEAKLLKELNFEKGKPLSAEKSKMLSELLYPSRGSFLAMENSERMKVEFIVGKENKEKKFSELDEKQQAAIKAHATKWNWIENNSLAVKRLDAEYFWELVKNDLEKPRLKERKKIGEEERKKILIELGLPEEILNLVKIMDEFAFFQDERKKYWIRSMSYLETLLQEIGKRKGISVQALKNAFFWEIEALMKGKDLKEAELLERQKYSVTIYQKEKPEIFIGEEARKKFEAFFGTENIEKEYIEMHGICACAGKAIGVAKVLNSSADVGKIQEGDILIARATDPEYVVAMKKAAAIVTDEGGITSHAAVVSRELNVPCLVGTKRATKMFKEGEMVEVDANHGVVRRIGNKLGC